ncbi:hypothetical protein F4777DRAFT_563055 [Nemania sp. FL0916]|nr:hypothetical protein F4777DRAFT_563055 [Nemania sp. FL0916]
MKNFGTIVMLLAASASSIAAMPTPGAEPHGIQGRVPNFYAQHMREAKSRKRAQNGAFVGNGTLAVNPASNITTDANGNGTTAGQGSADGQGSGNAAPDSTGSGNDLLNALIGLLEGAAGGQGAAGAAGGNDPLAIIQGLLNGNGAA